MKYCAGLLLILCALSSALADTVYVSTTSGSDGPGTSWDNAFHTIQGGVDAANSNDVVLVTNGIYNVGSMATPSYSSLNRVVVTNDITVISVNGPEVTVVVGAEATAGGIGVDAVRGVYMSAGTFSGFTVSNGYSWNSGDAYYDMHGGGINLYGGSGVVSNCIIRDCSALGAGAVAYGEVYGTIIKDNTAQFYGGGVAYSTLYNCVISQNQAASQGGGCYQSILYSCTVSGNHADSQSGGVHEGAVYNSIIYNNTAPDDDNWYDSTPDINYSCLTPLPAAGSGNITNNPMLLTSKQIATNSPCVGAGVTNYLSGTDIDGDTWGTPPAMGCDEPVPPFDGGLTVAIHAPATYTLPGEEIYLYADTEGLVTSNSWDFGDGASATNLYSAAHAWSGGGDFTVTLTAWNDDNLGGVTATVLVHIVSANYYVDVNNATPVYPYSSWATAANTIQDAVDVANEVEGTTVWVTNGVYDVGSSITPGYVSLNRVLIDNNITVRSINGPAVTVIKGAEATGGGTGADAVRGVYMSAGILSGFTITNGYTSTIGDSNYDRAGGGLNIPGGLDVVVSNCVVAGNMANYSAGGSYKGAFQDCMFSGNTAGSFGGAIYACNVADSTLVGNTAQYGGASYNSTLNNCIVDANIATVYGGGTYFGTANNSILLNNSATIRGGGAAYGTLNNCTIVRNRSEGDGGGCRDTIIRNSIVVDNSAQGEGDNWYDTTPDINYTCTTPLPGTGAGNITDDPMLVSASHIHASSLCVAAGATNYLVGTDIDGDAWNTPPAMGCDEPSSPYSGSLTVAIVATTNHLIDYDVTFFADISGVVASNLWDFDDGTTLTNSYSPDHSWSSPGDYAVTLTAWNDDNPGGVTATVVVSIIEGKYYADVDNPTPVYPYTNWTTAANTIQDAVDAATGIIGADVFVADGIYSNGATVTPGYGCSNRVVITTDMTVQAVNGPAVTIITGQRGGGGGTGSDAVRGVYMSAGLLAGFTMSNCHARTFGDTYYDQSGGGVNMYGGTGSISNCVVTGNRSTYGGGTYYGTVESSTLHGNFAFTTGGGCSYGTVNNCVISNNVAASAGGSYYATLNNCQIIGNWGNRGAGSYGGTVSSSIIRDNEGMYGGGTYSVTVNKCAIFNNAATYGGGCNLGTINDSVIYDNRATYGGGCYMAMLNNSTVTHNLVSIDGGGVFEGTIKNSIVYFNTAENLGDNWYDDTPNFEYSCTTPSAAGVANITADPLFINGANYRLQPSSPAIDSGTNTYMPDGFDLDGTGRPFDGNQDGTNTVDMGCYEYTGIVMELDGDGLSNFDEINMYGTDPNSADTDGDGQSDYDEVIAGTDANDSSDLFRVTSDASGEYTVYFNSRIDRIYSLLGRASLIDGDWQLVPGATNYIGIGGADSLQDTNNPIYGPFYTIQVELP